jgi:hypothetical protein
MTAAREARRHTDRRRFLWALLAAVILHGVALAALTRFTHLALLHNVETEDRRAMVSPSSIRIERRTTPRAQGRPKLARLPLTNPQPPKSQPETWRPKVQLQPQGTVVAPPEGASVVLPPDWAMQDYGNKAATDVKVYLDWTKQSPNFVPRVMLWQMQAAEEYMRRPSLQDAVQGVVTSLRARATKIDISKAQRVCGGTRPGWFLSYLDTSSDPPPLRVEETLLAVGETVYRATYVRPADQPEDPKARAALNTLCGQ